MLFVLLFLVGNLYQLLISKGMMILPYYFFLKQLPRRCGSICLRSSSIIKYISVVSEMSPLPLLRGITTYTIVLSECPGEKTEWELYYELFKNGEHIPSTDYLTIKENQQSTLGNVTTVSFNRSSLMNDNVDLKLYFYLYTYPLDTPKVWNKWVYYIN